MSDKLFTLSEKTGELTVKIFVTPKSDRNKITQLTIIDSANIELKAKIKGIPEKGKVNKELISFLAKTFKTAPSNIQITGGLKSRYKTLVINT